MLVQPEDAQPKRTDPVPVQVGPVVPVSGPPSNIPDISRTKPLVDKILERFPSTKVDYIRVTRLKVTTTPSEMKAVALFVRDQLGFDHIGTVAGTDYMQHGEIEVVYFVGSP